MPDKPVQVVGTLLTIGDEILLGDIPNGNAHHIARELRAKGFRLHRIVTVGDTEDDIAGVLGQCLENSHFIVTTGGLGPTDDDRTNSAVSKAFGKPLVTNRDYENWLKTHLSGMGRDVASELERMAALPQGAVKLGMDMAGFFLLHRDIPCYFLPGVPGEMKYLLESIVIPDLESRFPERTAYLKHVVRVQGLLEAEVNRRLRDFDSERMGVDIGYLPQGRENWITVFASAVSEQECRVLLRKAEARITELIGERNISGHDDDCLERVIGRQLRERGWKLAIAESCTGGLLSRRITSVAGASDYFDRAFITYSNQAKRDLLGVSKELLAVHGAVSEPVALAMAEGARAQARADVAVGITGIAGPAGGTAEKPVGTVFIACAMGEGRAVEKFSFSGQREQIQESAAHAALVLLWKMLNGEPPPCCG